MSYDPNPVNTDHVRLSDDLLALTEQLAENTHEVWARGRLEEGWRYGPQRDDAQQMHPGLVPYKDLSEAEKEYDRRTALETLKLILALGYEIRQR